jgi:NitT/TauT family transport system substrate-binding protein
LGGAPITSVIEHTTKVPYSVLAKKGITSIAQLKGKTIIIGGPTDITRVFMDRIMVAANLRPDDYTYTYAGATTERFAALVNGGIDAAILFPPFSFHAANLGYPVLDDVAKYFPSFLFDAFAVQTAYGKSHPDLVVAFGKSYLRAVRWIYEPANRARAIQVLTSATNTTPEDAAQTYDLFVTKLHLFSATGVSQNGDIAPVIDALVKIGQLKETVPPARFYDNTYVNQANDQLRRR